MIGAYSAISLRSRAVRGEAHDDDPAGLDPGHDAVAERGVHDVVADAEVDAPARASLRRPRDWRAPALARAAPADEASRLLRRSVELGGISSRKRLAQPDSRAPNTLRAPRVGQRRGRASARVMPT